MRGLDYSASNYSFITSSLTSLDTNITILECLFENLIDMEIDANAKNIRISNSTFSNITQGQRNFFSLSSSQSSNLASSFLFKNNNIIK